MLGKTGENPIDDAVRTNFFGVTWSLAGALRVKIEEL